MVDDLDAELRRLVQEGLVRPEEVESVRARSRLTGRPARDLVTDPPSSGATLPLPPDPDDPAPTTPPPNGAPQHPWPFPKGDRYEPIRVLGDGGMGVVWLATKRDLTGTIQVAIKLVRADDPRQLKLSVEEGRALAKVRHDRVCHVHEVGQQGGFAFIAMQFVDGPTLGNLESPPTAREIAMLIRDVARGVQVAHDVGVIHRDIKPSNILVQKTNEGLKPYLVDFGVARTWQVASTATRYVVGTPSYMSPEQAEGEVATLDHRADVYGLGATLYHLLTGQPPFDGKDTEEILQKVRGGAVKDPRKLNPTASEDLAAVAVKCLRKERADRYASAGALAHDLERYLSGDPVRAHAGTWYRLKRRLQKYAVPVALGVAALVALGGFVTNSVQSERKVRLARELERDLTQQVEQVEAEARRSALSPPHDLAEDREELRGRLAKLDEMIAKYGEGALARGKYARGKVFLTLEDYAQARQELEAAWNRGFQEPRGAYALALALGHEYQDKLTEAQRQADSELRKLSVAAVQRRYQGQILALLNRSHGVKDSPEEYLKALIAFYERRYDDALAQLAAVTDPRAWMFEIAQLRGDILRARAFERWEAANTAGQEADFKAALEAYAVAGEIARSLPSVHAARARLELFAMMADLFGSGRDVLAHHERGLKALEPIAKLTPNDLERPLLQAQLHRLLAQYRSNHGEAWEPPLNEALRAAEQARRLGPSSAAARLELAQAHWQRGVIKLNHSVDSRDDFALAAKPLDEVDPADRDADFFLIQGRVYSNWADAEDRQHKPSADHRTRAIEAFTAATKLDDQHPRAWASLASALMGRAIAPGAEDPKADLGAGQRAGEKALALTPSYLPSYYILGQIERERARRDRDPAPLLDAALDHLTRGHQLNPGYLPIVNALGQVQMDLAQVDWDSGRDPFPNLKRASETLQPVAARYPPAKTNLAEATAREARYLAALGRDPTAATARAVERFERDDSENPTAQSGLGLALIVQAEYQLKRGIDPQPQLLAARTAAIAATQTLEKDEDVWRVLGSEQWLEARWRADHGGQRLEGYEHAADTYEQGLKAFPDHWETLSDYAQVCLDWAERAPGSTALGRADRLTRRMLELRPALPEAHAFHAYAVGLAAKRHSDVDAARGALADIDRALAANPNLAPAWKDRRARLAAP